MLVSVIIPIYNVERYLDRCIESVIQQTYQNLEIILVDDGSPDVCPQMCDEWAKKDERIKVIHKENAGLGFARNSGLDIATGEAVCFIDSDDYVLPTMIADTVEQMQKFNADMVSYGFQRIAKNGEVTQTLVPETEKNVYEGEEIRNMLLEEWAKETLHKKTNLWMSAWSALFSRKAIEAANWRFVSERDIISEDLYSSLALYVHLKTVVVLPRAYYCYCENENSLTTTYRADRYQKILVFYHKTVALCRELGYSKLVVNHIADSFFSYTISALKMIAASPRLTNAEKKKYIKEICDDATMCALVADYQGKTVGLLQRIFWKLMKYKCYASVYLFLVVKCRR